MFHPANLTSLWGCHSFVNCHGNCHDDCHGNCFANRNITCTCTPVLVIKCFKNRDRTMNNSQWYHQFTNRYLGIQVNDQLVFSESISLDFQLDFNCNCETRNFVYVWCHILGIEGTTIQCLTASCLSNISSILFSINFIIFNFRKLRKDVRIELPAGWRKGVGRRDASWKVGFLFIFVSWFSRSYSAFSIT